MGSFSFHFLQNSSPPALSHQGAGHSLDWHTVRSWNSLTGRLCSNDLKLRPVQVRNSFDTCPGLKRFRVFCKLERVIIALQRTSWSKITWIILSGLLNEPMQWERCNYLCKNRIQSPTFSYSMLMSTHRVLECFYRMSRHCRGSERCRLVLRSGAVCLIFWNKDGPLSTARLRWQWRQCWQK